MGIERKTKCGGQYSLGSDYTTETYIFDQNWNFSFHKIVVLLLTVIGLTLHDLLFDTNFFTKLDFLVYLNFPLSETMTI